MSEALSIRLYPSASKDLRMSLDMLSARGTQNNTAFIDCCYCTLEMYERMLRVYKSDGSIGVDKLEYGNKRPAGSDLCWLEGAG